MEGNYITKEVHEEFSLWIKAENQRLEDENKRQNRRLSVLEENAKEIHGLTVSVERMVVNMENMLLAFDRFSALRGKRM